MMMIFQCPEEFKYIGAERLAIKILPLQPQLHEVCNCYIIEHHHLYIMTDIFRTSNIEEKPLYL